MNPAGMVAAISGYSERIEAELRAYNEVEQVHDLPLVHSYWAEKFVVPLFAEVGFGGIQDLWERQIAEQCARLAPEPARLVSLGAGNGEMELPLAARLAERGHENLELELLELNPAMIERALELAHELGLGDRVLARQADLNTWTAHAPADIYIAIHSLHHVVELEHLYDQVAKSITPEGVLLVNDMVGRNGHVRWPEAGSLVHRIWNLTPRRYRYNHFVGAVDEFYPDVDCSGEGFEGVRAQDVLPLLLQRFYPDVLVGFGNVADPFVDRVYGRNFDPEKREDAAFIDAVATLDEAAIDLGIITPTHLVASFRAKPVRCRHPRNRSPERIVRPTGAASMPDPVALQAELEVALRRYRELRARKIVKLGLRAVDTARRLAGRLSARARRSRG
jgi:SAM-dependent methyltransferase